MSEKLYVITFHTEDCLRRNSKKTLKKTATNIANILDGLEKIIHKCNQEQRVVIDFIYSEDVK